MLGAGNSSLLPAPASTSPSPGVRPQASFPGTLSPQEAAQPIEDPVPPDATPAAGRYRQLYPVYRDLYPALRDTFEAIGTLLP